MTRRSVVGGIADAAGFLLKDPTLRSVTVFIPARNYTKERVRVTGRGKRDSYVVTIGRPNYAEREFLKECKRADCHPRRFWFKRKR